MVFISDSKFRLNGAHRDAVELKKQLFSIESQVNEIKKQLHRLQDQKHELKRGLREEECELNHLITESLNKDSKEDDVRNTNTICGCTYISTDKIKIIHCPKKLYTIIEVIAYYYRSFPSTTTLSDVMERWR